MLSEEGFEQKTSKYNEAVSQIFRLNDLWKECHYYKSKGNLITWNNKLDCVWTELGNEDNEGEITEEFNKFVRLIVKYKQQRNILYQILMKKEIFLRKFQNKLGKGTQYKEYDEDDFE